MMLPQQEKAAEDRDRWQFGEALDLRDVGSAEEKQDRIEKDSQECADSSVLIHADVDD